jgi:hypothetical protein
MLLEIKTLSRQCEISYVLVSMGGDFGVLFCSKANSVSMYFRRIG